MRRRSASPLTAKLRNKMLALKYCKASSTMSAVHHIKQVHNIPQTVSYRISRETSAKSRDERSTTRIRGAHTDTHGGSPLCQARSRSSTIQAPLWASSLAQSRHSSCQRVLLIIARRRTTSGGRSRSLLLGTKGSKNQLRDDSKTGRTFRAS